MSDKVYNRLKFLALVVLPALGSLYFGLAQIWGFPAADKVTGSILVIEAFVGTLVKFSQMLHDASGAQYNGTLAFEETEDGTRLRMLGVDPVALDTKSSITFRVLHPPS